MRETSSTDNALKRMKKSHYSSIGSRTQHESYYMEHWYRVLEKYTECNLTRSEDRLPAISGLATAFADTCGLQYAAGLWQELLPDNLLWRVKDPTASRRHPTYRAPSWSWAAIDGEILFSSDRHKLPEELELDDIDIKPEPKGRDPFGQLLSGTLTVTGALKQLDFSRPLYRSNELLRDRWGAYRGEIYLDEAREPDGLVYGMLIKDEEHITELGDPVRA
jgi:hypothetical protein